MQKSQPTTSASTPHLAPQARLWIHPLRETIAPAVGQQLLTQMKDFARRWQSHGKPTAGEVFLKEQRFLFLVNPNEALGGCSIDSASRALRAICQPLNLDAFARDLLYYRTTAGALAAFPHYLLKDKIKAGLIQANTIVYNNQITHWGDYTSGKWKKAAEFNQVTRAFFQPSR